MEREKPSRPRRTPTPLESALATELERRRQLYSEIIERCAAPRPEDARILADLLPTLGLTASDVRCHAAVRAFHDTKGTP